MHTKKSWLLVGVIVGCLAGGTAADAGSGGPLRHRPTSPIGRPEVVIYVANEPGLGARRDSDENRLATQLLAAVMSEKAELIRILPRMPGHNGGAIFTNALARGGTFLAWDGDGTERRWHRVAWAPVRAHDPLLDAQNLALALNAAAARFPPDRYNYVLIVKSLATDGLALAGPRAAGDGDRPGVTREALFASLSDAGKRGMHFGLVYLDTPLTSPAQARQAVPANVTFFYGPGDFAPALNRLSYGRVLLPMLHPDAFLRQHPSLALVRRLEAIRLKDERTERVAARPDLPWRAAGAALLLLILVATTRWIVPSAKRRLGAVPAGSARRSGVGRLID